MILGVVLAGGQSSRFGSDKALAEIGGRTLLARAVDALGGHCEYVVVAGREMAPAPTIPDWPKAGMGPLGGIAAGLRLAQDEDYEAVLTCGVDSVKLPENLLELLSPAPACLADQPVVGLWPTAAGAVVERILESDGPHSMRAFAESLGARAVKTQSKSANINTPADLARVRAEMEQSHGL
jgi:molybdopterin-guanine dinucleotide biosynthesis protein A